MFRPWHPPKQRTSTSSRSTQRNAPPRLSSHPEDAQPNESVNKRQRYPPSINSAPVQHPPRRTRQQTRSEMQFRAWEPSESMRPTTGNSTSAPPNAAQSASDHTRRSGNSPSEPPSLPSEPPAPKRRKLEAAPFAEIKRGCPTEKVVSASTSSVSPLSSETLVSEYGVKRERSFSPELSAKPQLITAGSKRYTPLPPECKKSHSNHNAARNAWAKKEQEALKRLGLKVVRTFIREDGMVIDWETTDSVPVEADAVIERALLLNHAGILNPDAQSFKPMTPSLAHIFPDLGRPRVEEENRTPSVVEIATQAFEGHGRCESGEESGSSARVVQMIKPSNDSFQEGGSQQQERPVRPNTRRQTTVDALAPMVDLRTSPGGLAHDVPSDHTRHHKTTNNVPSRATPPSGGAWKQSSSPQTPYRPSQQRSMSPQLPQASPSPSRRAIDTLQHILYIKRQFDREPSDLLKPPVVSPSSSSPSRKLYPLPRTQKSGSPSGRSLESSADAVAAAINESTHLDRHQPTTTPPPSTSLRVYKRRPGSSATPVRRNESVAAPQEDEERQRRRSQSSGGHSSPPIAVLVPMDSSPASRKASSSAYGDEYDELELSFPSSPMLAPPMLASPMLAPPMLAPPIARPDPHLPALTIVLAESPPPVELVEPALQHSLSDIPPVSPEEKAAMESSALRYLDRYFRTFDADRRALAEAYTPDAFFSCSQRNLRAQGRDAILDALQALGPAPLFSGKSVEWDVAYLGPGIGVLLVVLGTMNGMRDGNGEVRYAMSFVLRPGTEDEQERPPGGLRPLVAAVHQMVLRDDTVGLSASGLMPSAVRDR